jgi:hypothetical protein
LDDDKHDAKIPALAGLLVGLLFNGTGLTPTNRLVTVFDTTVSWNYDTFLNIAFLLLMAVLLVRFLRTGGVEMLRMMEMPKKDPGPESAAP